MKPQELKRARAALGLTQAGLAEKLGVTKNTVARWEIGARRIPELAARLIGRLDQDRKEAKKPTKRKP